MDLTPNNFPFTRTSCGCENCVKCCKQQPGSLAPGDLERIAQYLNETPIEARKHFVASPGALVKNRQGEIRRVGTITPKKVKGRCVFLDDNNKCKIHAVAPTACAYFDTHMPRPAAMARSIELVKRQGEPGYQALRMQLPYTTSYKPFSY